ncbi:MAG: ATP-binding protein [Planctomycetaceae bacterium]|nr:ATP-binding protein [Planctomycetaceae bacterium]
MADILLVGGERERRECIQRLIQHHKDWNLIEATTGNEGRAAFQEKSVDLVIIDLSSAGPHGEELFEWIRDDQSRVPVIVLTADDIDDAGRVQALVMGAACYVPQSFVARDLVVTVERILGLSGCRRSHPQLMESLVTTETSYRIEDNDLSRINVLIGHLVDTANEFRVITSKNRVQISVALEEAITNGIVHGNLEVPSKLKDHDPAAFYQLIDQRRCMEPFSGRRLFVGGVFEPGFCRFSILDEGKGFDPAQVDDPTDPEHLNRPHGRGLFLIRAFMDEVEFNEIGNEILLTKRVAQP